MMKNLWLKKGLTAGIIILFLGLAIAPSTNANVISCSAESDLIEITTEICGLDSIKPYTIKITKEKAEQLEALFDTIRKQLSTVGTREETIELFTEAVEELDKLGLLPESLSNEDAQRLVCDLPIKVRNVRHQYIKGLSDVDGNLLCHIAGNATYAYFGNVLDAFLNSNLLGNFIEIFAILFSLTITFIRKVILTILQLEKPMMISFGTIKKCGYGYVLVPSEGWIWTNGVFGVKNWTGKFTGALFPLLYVFPPRPGVSRFRGIRITSEEQTYFVGTALRTRIM